MTVQTGDLNAAESRMREQSRLEEFDVFNPLSRGEITPAVLQYLEDMHICANAWLDRDTPKPTTLQDDAALLSRWGHDVVASLTLMDDYDIKQVAHTAARVGDAVRFDGVSRERVARLQKVVDMLLPRLGVPYTAVVVNRIRREVQRELADGKEKE